VTGKFSARQFISGSTRHDADTVSTTSLNTRPLLLFYLGTSCILVPWTELG